MAHRPIIRPATWLYVVLAIGELIALSGVVVLGLRHGVTWLVAGLAGCSLLFAAGFLDLAVSRIELAPDALHVIELLKRQTIARQEIVQVSSESGVVSLQLQDGRWLHLPDTGHNSLGVANTIRAWLKASG